VSKPLLKKICLEIKIWKLSCFTILTTTPLKKNPKQAPQKNLKTKTIQKSKKPTHFQ